MAWYRYDWAVEKSASSTYDRAFYPDVPAIQSGIYRCQGCGRELVVAQGQNMPPESHHQHAADDGKVVWRLTVYADHRPWAERD